MRRMNRKLEIGHLQRLDHLQPPPGHRIVVAAKRPVAETAPHVFQPMDHAAIEKFHLLAERLSVVELHVQHYGIGQAIVLVDHRQFHFLSSGQTLRRQHELQVIPSGRRVW